LCWAVGVLGVLSVWCLGCVKRLVFWVCTAVGVLGVYSGWCFGCVQRLVFWVCTVVGVLGVYSGWGSFRIKICLWRFSWRSIFCVISYWEMAVKFFLTKYLLCDFLPRYGGEVFLDEVSSVWFLTKIWCWSFSWRSIFSMVNISLLLNWWHSIRSSL
jgi:hypothetical protein